MGQEQWTSSVAAEWGIFLPPARPSLSELVVIETRLFERKKNNPGLRVGILGSTPEYRDLCQTYAIDYRCVDYRQDNFDTLGRHLLHPDGAERLIVSDWRKMEFPGQIDVWLGDLATTVTPVSDHRVMFENIRAHSRPGAEVILKVPLRADNTVLTHEQIFALYRAERAHLNPFAAVWIEVLLADYDFAADTMYCPTSRARLEESCRQGIVSEFEFGEFTKRWDVLGDFKMNIPLRSEFVARLREFFPVIKFTSGQDWYREQVPIIIGRY
ncbi:MAG: hypothetical protein UY92_C0001G0023 [Candidatus Magasanikbacteria bacterium GW2011_GWA2_56_11]|uniref:Uncharacterized protein n=1 Tax=Candidatus Magasanikbacteria bacterium GW2011_GWA2_56_11 TaxID=1619044 RepID=A0A0G2BBR2_9BACT|nr:MAG: hypothetical protein UY92_C0001G0023 [Candidatus Magasanikbacteria bacterium GW2011_GWA2_56_11]